MWPPPSPELIATAILSAFHALPVRSKPRIRLDGSREWVTLAGVAVEHEDGHLTCASLATGVKCLPANKIPLAQGLVLHDSHAEILALRAFNSLLLREAHLLLSPLSNTSNQPTNKYTSPYLLPRPLHTITPTSPYPFMLHPHLRAHLYTTELPCGDASMEFTIAASSDPTPWSIPPPNEDSTPPTSNPTLLRGRSHFTRTSLLRLKPSRPDAPPTMSKSCSDKLSQKAYLSVLSVATSYLVAPTLQAYLATLTVPFLEYNKEGCERAWGGEGRLAPLKNPSSLNSEKAELGKGEELAKRGDGEYEGKANEVGYKFRPFTVQHTSPSFPPFPYSRRPHKSEGKHQEKDPTPTNISTVYIPPHNTHETLISSVLQGHKAFSSDTTKNVLGASCVSKMRLWDDAVSAAEMLRENTELFGGSVLVQLCAFLVGEQGKSYEYLKIPEELELVSRGGKDLSPGELIRLQRYKAKERVRGELARAGGGGGLWVRNGGNGFILVRRGDIRKRKGEGRYTEEERRGGKGESGESGEGDKRNKIIALHPRTSIDRYQLDINTTPHPNAPTALK